MIGIHWFRFGLRMHDNPALLSAVNKCTSLLNVYILNPDVELNQDRVSDNRLWFLLDTLRCLDVKLREKGSQLHVCVGQPDHVITQLVKSTKATLLTYERQTEPHNVVRDEKVSSGMKEMGVQVDAVLGHTLFDPDKLLKLNGGSPSLAMKGFQTLVAKAGAPPKPQDAPADKLPPPPQLTLENSDELKLFKEVPELSDFKEHGYDIVNKTTSFKAGEDQAIETMEAFLAQKKRVATFEKPQTSPTSLEPDTTALSPYMSNGSLSCRLFYWGLMEAYKGRSHSQPPVSLEGQLLWREMAHLIGYSTPNFGRMEGNPVCRQIPWRTADDKDAKQMLDKWENGQIGFPAIDAVMNQLRTEGWMHHLARHLTACFLTRGDLWITWEAGRDVFEKYLLDADWHINNFSWHWLSCSAFFHQYFRCYSPVVFFKKTDPTGAYIRKHLPVLHKMPAKYIYEPWECPVANQQTAGCVLGKDYPKPPFNHSTVSKENMNKMKAAFDASKKAAAAAKEQKAGEPKAKKAKKN